MKKTYLNPELIVVKIATHQMLAGSPDETMSGKGNLGDGEGFSFGARDGDFDED